MHKANSIIINAPKSDIFETAATLELWPKILPHYRYIRYLARGPQRNLVVMAAVRSGIPISWTSEQVIDRDRNEIRFLHLKAWTKGMRVVWSFKQTPAGILVEMMEVIAAATRRRIDFFHIPVPKERIDAAYYAPLKTWKRPADTDVYLGLLHHADAGDKARVAAARKFIDDFGLSAECGWGRTEPGRLPGLLKGHRVAAEAF